MQSNVRLSLIWLPPVSEFSWNWLGARATKLWKTQSNVRLSARRSCNTSSPHETGMQQPIPRPPLQHQWRWTHWHRRDAKPKEMPRAQGRKALARHRGSQAMTKLARRATYAASRDTARGIAGTAKEHPKEDRPTARDRVKERPRAKVPARVMAEWTVSARNGVRETHTPTLQRWTLWPRMTTGLWCRNEKHHKLIWAKRPVSRCAQSHCARQVDKLWNQMDTATSRCKFRQS